MVSCFSELSCYSQQTWVVLWASPHSAIPVMMGKPLHWQSLEHGRSAQCPDCCRSFVCVGDLVFGVRKVSESLVCGKMKTLKNCMHTHTHTCTSKAHDLPPKPTPSPPSGFAIDPHFLLRIVLLAFRARGTHAGKSFHMTSRSSNEFLSLGRNNALSFTTDIWRQRISVGSILK